MAPPRYVSPLTSSKYPPNQTASTPLLSKRNINNTTVLSPLNRATSAQGIQPYYRSHNNPQNEFLPEIAAVSHQDQQLASQHPGMYTPMGRRNEMLLRQTQQSYTPQAKKSTTSY